MDVTGDERALTAARDGSGTPSVRAKPVKPWMTSTGPAPKRIQPEPASDMPEVARSSAPVQRKPTPMCRRCHHPAHGIEPCHCGC